MENVLNKMNMSSPQIEQNNQVLQKLNENIAKLTFSLEAQKQKNLLFESEIEAQEKELNNMKLLLNQELIKLNFLDSDQIFGNKNNLDNEEKHDKNLRDQFKELFIDWMSFTTIHGISRILDAQGFLLKLIWFIFYIGGLLGTLYLLITTIQIYFEFNEVTSTQIVNDLPAQFPTITICNLNPFHINYLNDLEYDKLNNYFNYCNASYMNCFNSDNLNSTSEAIKFQKLIIGAKNRYFLEQLTASDSDPKLSFQEKILNCNFNGISCMDLANDFETFPTLDNYFCFKFNSNKTNIKSIGRGGPNNGLKFTFYLGDPKWQVMTKNRGLRIYVHNNTEDFPNIDRNYVEVAPGFETNIGVKRTFYQRLTFI
jgi:hypothetical protein